MSAEAPKAEAVRYWWTRANECLAAARRDLDAGGQTFAISRAYYALFYAASAALLEDGQTFKKHAGVRAAFNRDIVKPARLSKEHGDLYNRLFRDRLKGDYAAFAAFAEAYVEDQLRGCEAFLRDIRPLLRSLPPEGEADGQD